jgi:glycine cleavage system regulatory protein
MQRFIGIVCLLFSVIGLSAQGLQSPEQFLGYPIGTKYTPHHKIVAYCNEVAAAKPDMVKIENYGTTYEGRPLMLLYIATPENLQKLETIRLNNLRLAGLSSDKAAPAVDGAPAIVWLSYNVHGNEPSSSEAAMLTLHALVDPANTKTKAWLKNTVVILDPCINPDGRDRYVNWFNSVVGGQYNADPQSREHSEPWPGGRSNHYNFDLNRDWAWQTQVETQQRIVKYNQWMPHVHVDFHEQGYNEPYYFAPAAEPFHEVITPWQRDFQTMIGKNNARYFDDNGWLYFTKERFDLFYPSYGDTYPTYNGAIGMTYEQGGHSRGGLGVTTADGELLTLVDRATHHFTTSLSTVEVAAQHAQKVVNEFKKYFDDSRAAKGMTYKTYVLTTDNENKLNSVVQLLRNNGIEIGEIANANFKGYAYKTGKEEAAQLKQFSIAVSALQPRSLMAKVLLEPVNVLPDSNTYDITAWSLPYAYGIDAYAVKEALTLEPYVTLIAKRIVPASKYGYLITYNSVNSAYALAQLLKMGVKVRMAEKPFVYKGKNFDRGTLIVLTKGNPANLNNKLTELMNTKAVQIDVVETGFMDKGSDFGSPDVKLITAPKIAMLSGEQVSSLAAGEIWHLFDQTIDYPVSLINVADFGRANLKNYQVLIVPDGYYRNLSDKAISDKLKEFVRSGGKLIAMENAVAQMAGGDWGIKAKADASTDKGEYADLKKYGNAERDNLANSIPGAIFKVALDNTHPLAFGFPDYYYTLKQDANLYEFMKEGWNVGVLKKDGYITGFSGSKVKAKLKDGLLFGVQEMGSGNVVYMADNPMFRMFWENGKLLFCNALFMVGMQ